MILESKDLSRLDELVSELEHDNKGLPILFKKYYSLNPKFLGFTVDKNFNNCLDCLILVDIVHKFPFKKLKLIMGEGIKTYLEYHSINLCEREKI